MVWMTLALTQTLSPRERAFTVSRCSEHSRDGMVQTIAANEKAGRGRVSFS
jgi:hypothetical protein